ncbi:hypothetical protein BDR26DRAFT_962476 [Obelidium mucronatum]|nr:hypothetical protein BDR26DRAFT_962476 [Obelidium mucronatum]
MAWLATALNTGLLLFAPSKARYVVPIFSFLVVVLAYIGTLALHLAVLLSLIYIAESIAFATILIQIIRIDHLFTLLGLHKQNQHDHKFFLEMPDALFKKRELAIPFVICVFNSSITGIMRYLFGRDAAFVACYLCIIASTFGGYSGGIFGLCSSNFIGLISAVYIWFGESDVLMNQLTTLHLFAIGQCFGLIIVSLFAIGASESTKADLIIQQNNDRLSNDHIKFNEEIQKYKTKETVQFKYLKFTCDNAGERIARVLEWFEFKIPVLQSLIQPYLTEDICTNKKILSGALAFMDDAVCFSQLQSMGGKELQQTMTQLPDFFEAVISCATTVFDRSNVAFHYHIEDIPEFATLDSVKLQRVLLNILLKNIEIPSEVYLRATSYSASLPDELGQLKQEHKLDISISIVGEKAGTENGLSLGNLIVQHLLYIMNGSVTIEKHHVRIDESILVQEESSDTGSAQRAVRKNRTIGTTTLQKLSKSQSDDSLEAVPKDGMSFISSQRNSAFGTLERSQGKQRETTFAEANSISIIQTPSICISASDDNQVVPIQPLLMKRSLSVGQKSILKNGIGTMKRVHYGETRCNSEHSVEISRTVLSELAFSRETDESTNIASNSHTKREENISAHNILLADSSSVFRKVLSNILKSHNITEASTDLQAIEFSSINQYSLVFMDFSIPVMFELASKLKSNSNGSLTIVIITSRTINSKDKRHLKLAGVSQFLEKPVSKEMIARCLVDVQLENDINPTCETVLSNSYSNQASELYTAGATLQRRSTSSIQTAAERSQNYRIMRRQTMPTRRILEKGENVMLDEAIIEAHEPLVNDETAISSNTQLKETATCPTTTHVKSSENKNISSIPENGRIRSFDTITVTSSGNSLDHQSNTTDTKAAISPSTKPLSSLLHMFSNDTIHEKSAGSSATTTPNISTN